MFKNIFFTIGFALGFIGLGIIITCSFYRHVEKNKKRVMASAQKVSVATSTKSDLREKKLDQIIHRYREKIKTDKFRAEKKQTSTAKFTSPKKSTVKLADDAMFQQWSKGWTKDATTRLKRKYRESIDLAAERHSVDPDIITSVIGIESGGRNVKGGAGEVGLMQCMPSTCKKYVDPTKLHLPHVGIHAGTAHIRDLQIRYNHDLTKTIAAYNRGTAPANIDPNKDYHLRKFYHLLSTLKN